MRGLTRAGKRASEMAFNAGGGAINWFPGHMAAASRAIRDRLKLADLVIEVRDARVSHPHPLPFLCSLLSSFENVSPCSQGRRGGRFLLLVWCSMKCLSYSTIFIMSFLRATKHIWKLNIRSHFLALGSYFVIISIWIIRTLAKENVAASTSWRNILHALSSF